MGGLKGLLLSDNVVIVLAEDRVYVGSNNATLSIIHNYKSGVLSSSVSGAMGFLEHEITKFDFLKHATKHMNIFKEKGFSVNPCSPNTRILKVIIRNFEKLLKSKISLEFRGGILNVKATDYYFHVLENRVFVDGNVVGEVKTMRALEHLMFSGDFK